ncbi:YjfP protein [Salmonella enterica subsp. enterica]|uniref:YjfP protein n=1 Tax=Salmonella enterica I TaxID=59201 RepID=A0A379X1P0_SALET|nr:YjfP protein [Salmonella enterica subsp. enterica]
MIAIETRQLAGGVVLHAFPEGKRAVPLPWCGVLSWLHLLQPGFIVILPLPWHRQDSG